jgi:uncharacterized protein (TIGR02453 family)
MSFQGFRDAKGSFFGTLAKNQNREWFQANKATFEEGWHLPMKALLADVFARIDSAFPHCDLEAPKVFRIYRDVRFSKDKVPYKTHIGGHISIKRTGKATEVPIALYFHVGHGECFAAAGHYQMDAPTLARFRAAVADEAKGRELEAALKRLSKKGFAMASHEICKRVPKGFDPEHPRAELLKYKGLTATFPETPKALLTSAKLTAHLTAQVKAAAPLVEWLVFATA